LSWDYCRLEIKNGNQELGTRSLKRVFILS
jgi:hypothetical protein